MVSEEPDEAPRKPSCWARKRKAEARSRWGPGEREKRKTNLQVPPAEDEPEMENDESPKETGRVEVPGECEESIEASGETRRRGGGGDWCGGPGRELAEKRKARACSQGGDDESQE